MSYGVLISMLALALLASAWLTRPLWRRQELQVLRRRQANVGAYQLRLAEIAADEASGQLSAEAASALREESGLRLLQDAGAQEPHDERPAPRRHGLAVLLAVLLAGLSGALYWHFDSWRSRELIALAASNPGAAEQQMVQDMIVKLQQRLKDQPDDAEGWAMLGRSQMVMGQVADAEKAYARANLLSVAQPQADWLVAQGEAHGMADAQRNLLPVRPLFEQALKLEPDNSKGLFYGGLAAMQAGDAQTAYQRWLKLREQPLPEGVAAALDQQLPELARRAGQTLPAKAPALSLKVRVSLSESLRTQLKPGMSLMVFAKAQDGPPMPLAVRRITSPQLPLSVTLDDSLAMMPSLKLSSFQDWVVTARLTSGAGAQALPGDLEGRQAVRRAQAGQTLDLLIDQQLP